MKIKKIRKTWENLPNNYKKAVVLGLLPSLVYFAFFTFYTWPWIPHFNTVFFTDAGDGFQNVWNMWWVNHSVTQLHDLPWHTSLLHHPYGTSLIGQTMNAFNGFVAIGLLKFLSLAQAYNTMVIFSFIAGGLNMFLLCYYFTKKYLASIVGGFVYTFSSYHFAHAIGHMQLVSLEWVPLFILLWWKFCKKPSYKLGTGISVSLLLVLLCDYYYFLYSVVTAIAIYVYLYRKKEAFKLMDIKIRKELALTSLLMIILVLPLPLKLKYRNSHDPLLGSHPARMFSTDLFAPFIDGNFWHFASLTKGYWSRIAAYQAESSIYLTISVLSLAAVGFIRRKTTHANINFWLMLGFVFAIFSLGPRLMVFGKTYEGIYMPYALLEKIFPDIKLSGMPIRMMFMVGFAGAIVSAMVIAKIPTNTNKHRVILAAICTLLFIELWPGALPASPAVTPKYLEVLKTLPAKGAVIDEAAVSESWQLYGQTIHEKPMPLGYISRVPTSVDVKDKEFLAAIGSKDYAKLCRQFDLKYITEPATRPLQSSLPIVYQDQQAIIYDNSTSCL